MTIPNKAAVRGAAVNDLLAEHIIMPGVPAVIVTRAWAYGWLADRGWNAAALDFVVFGAKPVATAATAHKTRTQILRDLNAEFRRRRPVR